MSGGAVGSSEVFRLVLLAMRQYLELYASLAGATSFGATSYGGSAPKPIVATVAEFRQARAAALARP